MKFNFKIILIHLFLWGGIQFLSNAYAQKKNIKCTNYVEYKANEGETLKSISTLFGSTEFTALIKSSNSMVFGLSSEIDSEVTLHIPYKVFHNKNSKWTIQEVLENPFCGDLNISIQSGLVTEESPGNQTIDTTETDKLQEFRSAFESLLEEERSKEQEEVQAKAEQQIFIELDGLVTDETRSKIGRDFYDIFYQQWEAPSNSKNFTIVISEQPTPSLGSFVSVSVNNEQIFRYRLQPRYEVIEQVATYAVRYTHNYMQENRHQYKIY